MAFIIEHDGKVIVGADDSDPLRCPECRRYISSTEMYPKSKLRCPYCNHNAEIKNFRVEFRQIANARVLVTI